MSRARARLGARLFVARGGETPWRLAVDRGNPQPIAAADPAAADDVGAQPAAVDERAQQRLAGCLGQVLARLTEARALAEDFADPEAAADELVEADAPRREVAPRLAGRELDSVLARQVLDHFGLDQRQVTADAKVGRVVSAAEGIAVTLRGRRRRWRGRARPRAPARPQRPR